MEVSRQVYISAVLLQEKHRYAMARRLLDRRVRQEVSQKKKISRICRDLGSMSLINQSSNYTDYSTSALLQMYPVNLLKTTGYVMHQQFNIQQLYALPTLDLCILYLSENKDLCHLQHKLIGFYNRDEKCLLQGKHWVF